MQRTFFSLQKTSYNSIFVSSVDGSNVVRWLQAKMEPPTAGADTSRHDSEVEREIDNFEQNKLKDIKVDNLTWFYFIELHCSVLQDWFWQFILLFV